jgi:regulator of sigma E protease
MNPAETIAPNDPTLYPNKSLLARTLTILAGPVANYLTASVLVFALALTGWREAPPGQPNQPANAAASKAPSQSHYVHKSVIEAARLAVVVPYTLTVLNLAGIAELVADRSTEGLMGPVGMGKLVAQRAEQGLYDYAGILILISVALGCFNLLPLPFLDGGRLTFLAYELVTHRKPSAKFEALVHATGMLALLTLVALVTWRDLIG